VMATPPETVKLLGFRVFVAGQAEKDLVRTTIREDAQREALRRRGDRKGRLHIEPVYDSSLVHIEPAYYDDGERVWVLGIPPEPRL
jgi:hypothetical protein